MPTAPSSPCPKPRCPHLQPCAEHPRRPFGSAHVSTNLYGTQRWRKRAATFLRTHPTCSTCGRKAAVADHVQPHRGDPRMFFEGELQPLCWPCSNAKTAREVAARRAAG